MISVVMNTLGEKEPLLCRAIESYLKQGCELIVSTIEGDRSIRTVKRKYRKVKIVTMPRRDHPGKSPLGSFLQLNNGLKAITGDWFIFGSSNDIIYPGGLEMMRDECLKTGREVCYSAMDHVYQDGSKQPIYFFEYDYDRHFKGNFVADCSLISRRLVDKYLPFRTELNNYAYWDLWLRIYEGEGNVFCYLPVPTWGYFQHPDSMHIKRFRDPKAMAQAEKDKQRMLKLHYEHRERSAVLR